MENTINKIMQIEEDAKRLVSEAKEHKESLESEIGESVERMKREIEARAEEKISQIAAYEAAYRDRELQRVRKQYENAGQILEETYQKQRKTWVDAIYDAVRTLPQTKE